MPGAGFEPASRDPQSLRIPLPHPGSLQNINNVEPFIKIFMDLYALRIIKTGYWTVIDSTAVLNAVSNTFSIL